ncbi:MAG TPA: methenyltetrahydromethanopterin cyclohydrolase, partial [Planctomycetaceae bacterium]|nr:methenyltetrahydromethanopterin cyclohydrolase [Planctomycetaceae bacterium]
MASGEGLNLTAHEHFMRAKAEAEQLSIAAERLDCGANLLDFGVNVRGGLAAGLRLASICMGGLAEVAISSGDRSIWRGPWIRVSTDHPVRSCLFGQYAGWPVQHEKFFAMGSGPMRLRRGQEPRLKELSAADSSPLAVG